MRTTALAAIAALSVIASPAPRATFAFQDHAFIVTGDTFSPGNCAAFELDSPWTSSTGLEPVGAVPALRHFLGLHWVVDRSPGGEIQAIDPATFDTVVRFTVGGSPRDILVTGPGTAWVTRHDSPWLLVVDPDTGAPLDSLDLGGFADADGIPEMAMMARDGDHLFVQIQRRNVTDQPPFLPGLLAVVHLPTRSIVDTDPSTAGVQAIALTGFWPDHRMQVEAQARRLYVSTPGPRLEISGGIEEIDLDSLRRLGFLISEETVSADIGGFILVSDTKGYYIAHTDIVESSHLTSFSRPDGTPILEAYTGLFYTADNVAYDAITQQLFFANPVEGGIHVFDAVTDARLTTMPVSTGGGPIDLLVARDSPVDAPLLPTVVTGPLSWAVPNPTRGRTEIRLARPVVQVQATILDVRGAIVRTLHGPPLLWDGRDDRGGTALAGIYFYRLRGDVADAGRLVILR